LYIFLIENNHFFIDMDIHTQEQLLEHFRRQLKTESDWRWISGEALCLYLDGKRVSFDLQAHVHYHALDLEQLARQNDPAPLLLVPKLTDRFLEKCRQSGLSVIDLNGRTWIRGKGLYIERPSRPDRNYQNANKPRNVFEGKSARIIRALLSDRDRKWTQSELIRQTGASQGLVSRVTSHLVEEGHVIKPEDRLYQVGSTLDLLDAWAASDSLKDRTTCVRFTGLETDPRIWADRLEAWAQDTSTKLAFTQWTAAWERHGYTEPVVCSAYVSELPTPDQLAEWGAREVSEAGAMWLFKPSDKGVFLETQQPLNRSLVSDAQIYIDLQKTGLRGPEAADALRNWEGFCRP